MKYLEIFNEVVSIMHNDYSGCIDNKGGDNPEEYAEIIKELEEKNELDDAKFTSLVKEYIAYFKDYHVNFTNIDSNSNSLTTGFVLRKFKDKLYVTRTTYEKGLEIGDAIVEVDGMDINTLAKKYEKLLHYQPDERQSRWGSLLINHENAIVEKKNGEKVNFKINKYNFESNFSEYTLDFIKNDEIVLFKIMDFNDEVAIRKLVEDNFEKLEKCEKWIVDVRTNYGGSDLAYFPLLNYILEEGQTLKDIDKEDDGGTHLMSERNCNNRIKLFKNYLNSGESIPEETKKILEDMIKVNEDNRGKGFVNLSEDIEVGLDIKGKKNPQKVIILSDVLCGSSGDSFVLQCSRSSKVTTVGRNTLGIIDYSNCAFETIGDRFRMMYATSRSSRVDKGIGFKEKGIPVDVHIPWTPEMCERDMDMEKALEILEAK